VLLLSVSLYNLPQFLINSQSPQKQTCAQSSGNRNCVTVTSYLYRHRQANSHNPQNLIVSHSTCHQISHAVQVTWSCVDGVCLCALDSAKTVLRLVLIYSASPYPLKAHEFFARVRQWTCVATRHVGTRNLRCVFWNIHKRDLKDSEQCNTIWGRQLYKCLIIVICSLPSELFVIRPSVL
jgi:hypothetical protein